ncbi:translocation and assembly module TamA [Rhizomicrobium palustre]|uniref:Translocation and assembly module TamA n=2 Tax=Rhizomicrobium palustre TaxID=189966 RepID=A0A846N270_9PROT|nr:translocation and assembly module TamA [Rhizomicrobium palustre]
MSGLRFRIAPAAAAALIYLAPVAFEGARAADPQGYTLSNPDTGDDELDTALKDSSLLILLRSKTPAPPFALIDRARGDFGRFQTVLESFGYYQGKVSITIAGRDVNDKTLPDFLESVPQGQTVEIKSVVERGTQYTLRNVSFHGTLPPGFDAASFVGVSKGDPAVAADVLGGQGALLSALQERGYAFAKVGVPDAYADDAEKVLDVSYNIEPGPRVNIGAISFQGLKHVREDFARESLTVHTGDLYNPSAIEASRLKLVGLGVFSGVSVRAADHEENDHSVPLLFDVQESKQHAVALSGAYSTDLGVSLSASWSHRNLLGRGEQLNLLASGIGLGGSATSGLGYNLQAQFIQPRFLGDDQAFEVNLAAVKQDLDAYDQTAQTFGIYVRKHFSKLWNGTAGMTVTHDLVSQQGTERTYELVALPVTAQYDSTGLKDPLSDPVKGGRGALSITPTIARGKQTVLFTVIQASGSYYFDLSGNGHSVIATRALLGTIQGGSTFDLPPDQRLYAGGSGSVRGFRYQSIGPHFANGDPTGASSVDAVSVELRQRLWSNYGLAAFVDAGQASESDLPFNGSVQVGAGIGARYYTSIGAIRADVAIPVTKVPNGDAFEIYLSIGQAF